MDFQVKALHAKDGVVTLLFDAADAADATRQANAQGYSVLSVHARQNWAGLRLGARSRFPVNLFSQELLALLKAGLAVVEALEALAAKEQAVENKRVLDRVIVQLYEGKTLSQALQHLHSVFPPLYIAIVRASEKTGDLPEALGRYIAYQSQLDIVRKKIVSASIYPVILIIVGSLVTMFLMAYVVPRFSQIYEDLGDNLPWLSQLLLKWGKLLQSNGSEILFTGVVVLVLVVFSVTRPLVRASLSQAIWRIPALGERMRVYQLARFYRALGMLLRGGIPIVSALDMASGLLSPALGIQLRLAARDIKEGRPMSVAFETHGLTTPVALRLVAVGERTGQMGEMLEHIASFYDDEMARWVEWFTKLFEPLLMAIIGVMIGTIVVLMYMPVFELAGSIE